MGVMDTGEAPLPIGGLGIGPKQLKVRASTAPAVDLSLEIVISTTSRSTRNYGLFANNP